MNGMCCNEPIKMQWWQHNSKACCTYKNWIADTWWQAERAVTTQHSAARIVFKTIQIHAIYLNTNICMETAVKWAQIEFRELKVAHTCDSEQWTMNNAHILCVLVKIKCNKIKLNWASHRWCYMYPYKVVNVEGNRVREWERAWIPLKVIRRLLY